MIFNTDVALQNAVNGLLIGGTYATVSLGFSLVWGILNIVNLAHGAFVMLGAYETYWLFTLYHVDPLASLPLTAAALFALGYPIQRYVINLVIRASFLVTFLLTFGLELLINSGRSLLLGPVVLPLVRVATFAVAVAVAILLHLLLTRTRLGSAIRATASDQEAARLMGIPIAHVYALTFGIAAATAAIAGGLISLSFPIYPAMDAGYTFIGFVVCALGGLGSVPGALLGGVILGLLQTYTAAWLGPNYDNLVAFAVLILILLLRPAGLLGRVQRFRG
ncbi:MAG: branched-chain amino acid ABC transporter permease [Bacillati bacterium ANGP1]|uniref:Branched-chain amino acid ABC transporter permease n=1 Tax=Candidatus Segetimicrobium genomatis TaxID=2569760 RepID=A0A537JKV0_9BACT|nr:MAG: branched-chain amino acid ABC transporter permease [Terrabacteria group bacterium ANGP1]